MTGKAGLAVFALLYLLAFPVVAAESRPDESVVSLVVVGDIMLAETPGRQIAAGDDPFAPFAAFFKAADVRIGNLECVVATGGAADAGKYYSFRAHPSTLNVLKRHIDAVTLANNHSGDFGPAAFGEMLALLEQHQIPYFGGGADLERAHKPLIIERKGLRMAFLGFNEFAPRSFEAAHDKPGVAWSEDEQVRFDIANARSRYQADLVIPVMHWGWEFERQGNSRQRQLARLMIDAGADAVIGGHPHVTQDIEHYQGKPIIYSLGNFIFDGFDTPETNTGWLLRLELDRQGVRAWQTVVAHIDRVGTPHPGRRSEGMCWARGMEKEVSCSED